MLNAKNIVEHIRIQYSIFSIFQYLENNHITLIIIYRKMSCQDLKNNLEINYFHSI